MAACNLLQCFVHKDKTPIKLCKCHILYTIHNPDINNNIHYILVDLSGTNAIT